MFHDYLLNTVGFAKYEELGHTTDKVTQSFATGGGCRRSMVVYFKSE